MFTNPEITVDELPSAAQVEWQLLDRRYVMRLQVKALISGGIALAALLLARLSGLPIPLGAPYALAWIVVGMLTAAGLLWPIWSVPRKRYAVRDKDILYRAGVFWQSVTAIPFNRMQHVETSSTPLDRRFGLATLQLFTAGGAGGDLKIHGLPADIAERLRTFMLERIGGDTERD
ncbi:MAG TPA: PH domain-containing protein [Woeseiaceae bacterium]